MADSHVKPPAQVAAERVLGNTALALISRIATPLLLGVASWMVIALVEIRQDMVRLQAALQSGIELASVRRDNDLTRLGAVEGRVTVLEGLVRSDQQEIVALRLRASALEEFTRRYAPPAGGAASGGR